MSIDRRPDKQDETLTPPAKKTASVCEEKPVEDHPSMPW
jgi:hypothetical protein